MAVMLIEGVVLILRDRWGRFYLVKELNDKPHIGKICGMLSFPMETSGENEIPLHAVLRLIEEEVGARIQGDPTYLGKLFFEADLEHHITSYTIHVFVAEINPVTRPHPHDTQDVAVYGWVPLAWLRDPPSGTRLRREMRRIIDMIDN